MINTNKNNMMHAVLMDKHLMEIGNYTPTDIPEDIYSATNSDNYLINVVATIISRQANGAKENEIYKQINQYLQNKL